MDVEDLVVGGIVYLKHLRFMDNMIDCRMNGRPYIIYKIKRR